MFIRTEIFIIAKIWCNQVPATSPLCNTKNSCKYQQFDTDSIIYWSESMEIKELGRHAIMKLLAEKLQSETYVEDSREIK